MCGLDLDREAWPLAEMYVYFLWVIFLPIWLIQFLSRGKRNYYLHSHKILSFQEDTNLLWCQSKSGIWRSEDWQNCSSAYAPAALFRNTSESWYAQTQCMSVIFFTLKMVVGKYLLCFINYSQLHLFKCSTVMHLKRFNIQSYQYWGNLSVTYLLSKVWHHYRTGETTEISVSNLEWYSNKVCGNDSK